MSVQDKIFVNLEYLKNELKDLPEELLDALTSIIRREGYVSCSIAQRMVSTKGGNFLGILYEVDIKGTTKEGEKETNLFIKQAMVFKKIQIVSIANIYSNEVYVYNDLAKIVNTLQSEASVPEKERYIMAKGYEESSDRAIILENLGRQGYQTVSRLTDMSLKFAELSVEKLAKFHGLSFVIQKKMPDFYETTIKNKKQPVQYDADWNVFITNICNKVSEVLNCDVQEKIKKLVPKIHANYQHYLNDDAPVCVLCHGDYKSVNIMVKEINGEILEALPLDYQMIYHGCPVTDFIFFIFTSTDQQFRRDHLQHLKSLYHDSLRRFLEYFQMDVEIIFPLKQFEQIYEERLEYGLMTGLFMSFFLFVPEDELPDSENQTMSEFVFNPNNKFKNWIRGLVDDFISWGYL